MKKIKQLLFVGLILTSTTQFLSSCKKCSHCVVKDSSGNIIKDYGEKCGTSQDKKDYESSAKKDAEQYNGTCNCS